MSKRKQIIAHTFNQRSALSLVNLFNDYVNDNFFDNSAKSIFIDIPLMQYAIESVEPNEKSAIHKVLGQLSLWYDLFLGYDNWYKPDIEDSIPYIVEEFNNMGIAIPNEFYTENITRIQEAINRLRPNFIAGLQKKIHASFLNIWNNKELCYLFNLKMSNIIRTLKKSEYSFFEKDGVLPRYTLPSWAQYLIIHRDYGTCQFCGKQIASPLSPVQDYQFDHIIPLAQGGTNDVSNFMLSCSICNRAKSTSIILQKTIIHWPKISDDFF